MFLEPIYCLSGPDYWPTSKSESIFKNFDPEKYGNKRWRDKFKATFGSNLLDLVRSIIDVCAYWVAVRNEGMDKQYLTNFHFIRLANISHDLYLFGCEIEETEPVQIFHLYTSSDWEMYIEIVKIGYTAHERLPQRPGQVMGMCILLMLDRILSTIKISGFDKATANDLLVVCRLQLESERNDDAVVNDQSAKMRAAEIAKSGGDGRSAKYKALEAETIRLYVAGEWASTPAAAQEITPKIVALSKKGAGDLAPTTQKPLEWIRAHVRSQKKVASA